MRAKAAASTLTIEISAVKLTIILLLRFGLRNKQNRFLVVSAVCCYTDEMTEPHGHWTPDRKPQGCVNEIKETV